MASIERLFTGRVSDRPQEQTNALEARIRALELAFGIKAYRSDWDYSPGIAGNDGTDAVTVNIEVPEQAKIVLLYYEMEIDGVTAIDLYEPTDYAEVLRLGPLTYDDPGDGFPGTWIASGPGERRGYGAQIALPRPTPGNRSYRLRPVGFSYSRERFFSVDVL